MIFSDTYISNMILQMFIANSRKHISIQLKDLALFVTYSSTYKTQNLMVSESFLLFTIISLIKHIVCILF